MRGPPIAAWIRFLSSGDQNGAVQIETLIPTKLLMVVQMSASTSCARMLMTGEYGTCLPESSNRRHSLH